MPKRELFFFRIKSIGIGAHSIVYLVEEDQTHTVYAQKSINMKHALEVKEDLVREIVIQMVLSHSKIIRLYHVYQD